jgi:hypothetical protein
MGALDEDIFTFITVSQGILLRMGNVSDKSRRENQNIVCSITILQKLCHC